MKKRLVRHFSYSSSSELEESINEYVKSYNVLIVQVSYNYAPNQLYGYKALVVFEEISD